MPFVYSIFIIIVLTIISLTIFNYFKNYLVSTFKNRKWLLFILMFLLIFIPITFSKYYNKSIVFQLIQTILFVLTFLTYFEIIRISKIEKQKPVVGRPKPKPRRVKKDSK